MPGRKEDAHRALELLEEYSQKLTRPQDLQLKQALEQVIKIFKSSLFQALLDIQEFYESILLDDSKSLQQKTQEAQLMSSKFTKHSPFASSQRAESPGHRLDSPATRSFRSDDNKNTDFRASSYAAADFGLSTLSSTSSTLQRERIQSDENGPVRNGQSQSFTYGITAKSPTYSSNGAPSQSGNLANGSLLPNYGSRTSLERHAARKSDNADQDFEYEDVMLERGPTGFGFSFSGGNDSPHFPDDPSDVSIYISKIVEGGSAYLSGKLRVGDIVAQINDDEVVDVDHQTAVDALKKAGKSVVLRVKRLRPVIHKFRISKGGRGLGISIAGGINNEHIPGDNGIYITKIVDRGAAALDGRLRVNDKIIAVGETSLVDVNHDEAVSALKNTGDYVDLVIERRPPSRFDSLADSSRSASATPTLSSQSVETGNQGSLNRLIGRNSYHARSVEDLDSSFIAPMAKMEEINQDVSRDVRTVVLAKGPNGLGFNIVGGEEGQGIFISYIVPGGVCDLSGLLRTGDRILSVNGVNLRRATHEEAADALKNSGQNVAIVVQYRPDEYRQFEERIQEIKERMINASNVSLKPSVKRSLYVRALFDYDPSRDSGLPSRGLPFFLGDILHVTNASDDEWWQAKRVNWDGQEEGLGIIPSKQRYERRERARLKSVKFEGPSDGNRSASTSTLDRLTGRSKKDKDKNAGNPSKKFGIFKGGKDANGDDTSESEKPEEKILSYEPVVLERLKYVRPVIVMGPFKDRINDELLAEFPERFASCVPHTSRPKRDNEIDGRDYHFVESREQLEREIQNGLFIEVGAYCDNLYGTSVQAVRAVAETGKHCVLDVSGAAVKRLHNNNLYPIVIYAKPKSVESIMEMNRRMTEEAAQKAWEKSLKLEKEFGHLFTAHVTGDTPEEIYNHVKEVIYRESGEKAWIPSKERL